MSKTKEKTSFLKDMKGESLAGIVMGLTGILAYFNLTAQKNRCLNIINTPLMLLLVSSTGSIGANIAYLTCSRNCKNINSLIYLRLFMIVMYLMGIIGIIWIQVILDRCNDTKLAIKPNSFIFARVLMGISGILSLILITTQLIIIIGSEEEKIIAPIELDSFNLKKQTAIETLKNKISTLKSHKNEFEGARVILAKTITETSKDLNSAQNQDEKKSFEALLSQHNSRLDGLRKKMEILDGQIRDNETQKVVLEKAKDRDSFEQSIESLKSMPSSNISSDQRPIFGQQLNKSSDDMNLRGR